MIKIIVQKFVSVCLCFVMSFYFIGMVSALGPTSPISVLIPDGSQTVPLNTVCCNNDEHKGYKVYGDAQPRNTLSGGCEVVIPAENDATGLDEDFNFLAFLSGPSSASVDTSVNDFDVIEGVKSISRSVLLLLASPLGIFTIPSFSLHDPVLSIWFSEAAGYHDYVNEQFALAVQQVKSLKTPQDWKDFNDKQGGECNPENNSPSCLAERLLCSYEKYSGVLWEAGHSKKLPGFDSRKSSEVGELIRYQTERQSLLVEEAVVTREALDVSLLLYNEFIRAWKLHVQYKDVVDAVSRVRDWTAHLRYLLECFPSKFVGVATTACD